MFVGSANVAAGSSLTWARICIAFAGVVCVFVCINAVVLSSDPTASVGGSGLGAVVEVKLPPWPKHRSGVWNVFMIWDGAPVTALTKASLDTLACIHQNDPAVRVSLYSNTESPRAAWIAKMPHLANNPGFRVVPYNLTELAAETPAADFAAAVGHTISDGVRSDLLRLLLLYTHESALYIDADVFPTRSLQPHFRRPDASGTIFADISSGYSCFPRPVTAQDNRTFRCLCTCMMGVDRAEHPMLHEALENVAHHYKPDVHTSCGAQMLMRYVERHMPEIHALDQWCLDFTADKALAPDAPPGAEALRVFGRCPSVRPFPGVAHPAAPACPDTSTFVQLVALVRHAHGCVALPPGFFM